MPSPLPWDEKLWQQHLEAWLYWQPTLTQITQFKSLYDTLILTNRYLNLTRITKPEEFLEKHLWDSLYGVSPWLANLGRRQQTHGIDEPVDYHTSTPNFTLPLAPWNVIDIGTGGGFPGIPVAIAFPDWYITLLDATRKKIDCLSELVRTVNLLHTQLLLGRAESVGQEPLHRAQYDLALIRAVGGVALCAEYALPLLKLDGMAIFYRGQWTTEEEGTLVQVLQLLGGQLEEVTTTTTPLTNGQRHCLYIRKSQPTPLTYPRPVGIPGKKPLP